MCPYSTNRASGLNWLVDVPEHWTLVELGRIGTFSKGGGGTKEDEVDDGIPCVRYGDLYTKHQFLIRETRARISKESAVRYVPLHYGDLLFAGSGETIEEIGKSAANLLTEPAYCGGDVILFRPAIEIDATFLGYAADCSHAVYQKSCMGRGVTVMHIYASELKHLQLPIPPLDEQRDIAAFLDRETERIDSLIAKKRLLIERLQEYRTALITRTVTRGLPPEAALAAGLDPSPRLKPSGVEWIGDVLEHWEVGQLKRWFKIMNGGTPKSGEDRFWDGDIVWLTPDDLGRNQATYISEGNRKLTTEGLDSCSARLCPEGSIALSTRAPIGHVAITSNPSATNQGCRTLVPTAEIDSEFAYFVILAGRSILESLGQGSTFMELGQSDLGCLRLAKPPLDEQRLLVSFLTREIEKVAAIVSCAEVAMRCHQEYRTALITAAVTGKIDVRDEGSVTAGLGE